MTKVECQDLINEFYDNEVRRTIRVSTNRKFNRTTKKEKNKGVAIAAPRKKK